MEPQIVRLGSFRENADAIADLHTRSRRVAYRGLYSDAYLDEELFDASRAVWRARFDDFDVREDLLLAAMDGGAPIALAYASFRLKPDLGALLDNLHVAPEHKGRGLGSRLLAEIAGWLVNDHAGAPLHLEVYAPNTEAVAFYRRKGGVETARYPETVPGGREVMVACYRWPDPATLIQI